MLASLGRHPPAGLGLLVLDGTQDLARNLHLAEGASREALAPDDDLVQRMAEGEVPPQIEGGLALVALLALGARGGGAAKLPLLREKDAVILLGGGRGPSWESLTTKHW